MVGTSIENWERADQLRLYEIIVDEQKKNTDRFYSQISFYTGLISVVVGVTLAGIFRASEWYQYLILIAGPFILSVVAMNGIRALERVYVPFLEAVVFRAKLEELIGISASRLAEDASYWSSDTLVGARHLASRAAHDTSSEFVEANKRSGDHGIALNLMRASLALAGALTLVLLFLAVFVAGDC